MADEVKDTDDTTDVTEAEVEHQTVKRLPPERTVGPFFPSGMSNVEAAIAGATAGMSDEDKSKVQEEAKNLGLGDESTAADVQALNQATDTDDGDDRPPVSAPKADWEAYRQSQGKDTDGLTKDELIGLD